MFSLQQVAGFTVVKSRRRGRPLDQREVHAIVVRVTARASLAGAGLQIVRRVQTAMCLQAGCDFRVTLQALQLALPADLVTRGAMGGAFQSLVWAGQRTRRNLGVCCRAHKQESHGHERQSQPRGSCGPYTSAWKSEEL